jgi:hypothetical protein
MENKTITLFQLLPHLKKAITGSTEMKRVIKNELCCEIVHERTLLPLGLISLYEVAFTTGKYAVMRLDKDQHFHQGDVFKRINDVWYCDEKLIHPLSFQFVDKTEAQRSFMEYER